MSFTTRVAVPTLIVVAALAVAPTARAQHTVIDFTPLGCGTPEVASFPTPVTTEGYQFDNSSGADFATWCSSASHYPGSAALFNSRGFATTTMTRVGGGAFNLYEIALAQLYNSQAFDVSIVFTGVLANASTVTQTFDFLRNPGAPVLHVFVFDTDFRNLVSVSWDQGGDDLHQFDDIHVAAVPEPATLATLASGLAVLGAVAARRRRRV